MNEHTKEPWSVDQKATLRVKNISDRTICSCGTTDLIRDQWEANARRIVACVNACEGLPTELIEKHGVTRSGIAKGVKEIERQRDNLLKAIERYLPESDHISDDGVRYYEELYEVIASVKGQS